MKINKYKDIAQTIKDAEIVAKAFNISPFSLYILGGSGCILGKYSERATRDIDFVDMNYSAKLGKVFAIFRDYDILEYESTILSPKYRERAIRINDFKYLKVYVLAREDIIVSKIIRLAAKDIEDIDELIKSAKKKLILQIIDEVIIRNDLFESKKEKFLENLKEFKEKYNV